MDLRDVWGLDLPHGISQRPISAMVRRRANQIIGKILRRILKESWASGNPSSSAKPPNRPTIQTKRAFLKNSSPP